MASRTKQKEEARARRLAEERERHERQRRQRRLQMVLGTVLAAVAVIVVAIVISSSGANHSTGILKGTKRTQAEGQVAKLLAGIPQSGAVLGNPNAPVTMIYYGDLQCPICKDFTLQGGFPQLVANDVKSGKVKVVYRAFQTATRDPTTFQNQQAAALAAGKQNHFWDFAELFYREQGAEGTDYANDTYLANLAQQIPGLNLAAWHSARSDSSLTSQVRTDEQDGGAAGVNGTPTLIFQGPKGKSSALSSVPSYGELQNAIKSVQ